MKQFTILAILASMVVVGCAGPDANAAWQPPRKEKIDKPLPSAAEAGAKIDPTDPKLTDVAKTMVFASRANPFSLLSSEVKFDRDQLSARLTQEIGFYEMVGSSKERPADPTFQYVQEPDRRLAGVMIGDTVSALIDMNDGSPMQIIRPGSTVKGPGGQDAWVVVSIDEEKAVLQRIDKKIRPAYIVVRLQTDLGGGTSGGGNTGGGGGGAQGAGSDAPTGNTGGGGNNRGGGGGRGRRDD